MSSMPSMKLGFALKKPKKTPGALAAAAAAAAAAGDGSSAFAASEKTEAAAREFVTSFDAHAVALDASGHAKRALVIPLLRANAWAEPGDKSADERAADALLADAAQRQAGTTRSDGGGDALVIPMAGGAGTPPQDQHPPPARDDPGDARAREIRARLFTAEPRASKDGAAPPPTAPILRQNAVPGMDALADANDKYRLDVSLRPDALDVHSEAYALVPVEDFGAALLRGMGWKGSVDADAKSADPKPRHKLLGLGATARPPMPGDAKNKRKVPPGSSSSSSNNRPEATPRESGLNRADSGRRSERDERRRERSASRDGRRTSRDGERASSRRSGKGREHERERSSDRRRSDDRRKRSRSRSRESRRDDDRGDDRGDRKRASRW